MIFSLKHIGAQMLYLTYEKNSLRQWVEAAALTAFRSMLAHTDFSNIHARIQQYGVVTNPKNLKSQNYWSP